MFRNYFIIAWRILVKNKLYSAINISGLAIGFACCVALGMYIYDEWNYDRFHHHKGNIYRLVSTQTQTGGNFEVAVTPGPLAPALAADFPEIIQTCRIGKQGEAFLEVGERLMEPSQTLNVDASFFQIFDFKLIKGNQATALAGPDDVILSEKMAIQCFGMDWESGENIVGRSVRFGEKRLVTIVGVIQDPPANSHLQFDVLLSFKYIEKNNQAYNWDSNNFHTYLLLRPQTDLALLKDKLTGYLKTKNKYSDGTKLSLQPMLDIHLHSDFAFHTDWSKTSSMVYIRIFFAVGLIVLLIALFNFINLSTAKAVQRMREVGVRKTIGAGRIQLVAQFFGESIMLSFLAIIISFGLLLGFLPMLNAIAGKTLTIPYTLRFFIILIGFALTSGFLAGIYPAIYLSGFKPAKVLKGIFDLHSGKLFRQVLVVSQFTLSIILVIGTLIIYRQLNFLQNKDLGFDQSQLINLKMKSKGNAPIKLMKQELMANTSIVSAAATSATLIDVINSTGRVKWQDQGADEKLMFTTINIDPDYLATSGIHLIAGRNFESGRSADTITTFIINETAASKMGWSPDEAVGKSFTLWDKTGHIIGVTSDFHFKPLTTALDAFVFRYWPEESFQYLLIKIKPNRVTDAISAIEKVYKKIDPKTNLQFEFVNELIENQYRTQQRSGKVILYFSVLTIFISCLGLLGLVTFATELQTKQIGIRKVLGASISSIVQLLSREFILLVLVAIIISIPVSILLMNRWLQTFAYKINLEWGIFANASLMVLFIALFTLSIQTIQSARANPVKALRMD